MSVRHDPLSLAETSQLVGAPAARSCTDRNFNLPVALYAGFFGLFLAYLGVMAFGFFDPQMIIPIAVFVLITIAFYVLPMLWTKVGPENSTRSMRVDQMMAIGVDTHTGKTSGGAAAAQVLVLPVLILLWGIVAVTIAALV